MWCPEGYITLAEIGSAFDFDSDLVGSALDRPSLNSGRFEIDTGLDATERLGFSIWLHFNLLRKFHDDFRVCPLSGIPLRLAPWVFAVKRPNVMDFNDFQFGFPNGYDSRVNLARWTFSAIDVTDGVIRSDLPEHLRNFGPIAGLPLCIQESKLPVRVFDLARWLLNQASAESEGDIDEPAEPPGVERPKGGRPSLQTEIIKSFELEYPKGLMGASLVRVADKLGYDRKTVRTALIASGHYSPK